MPTTRRSRAASTVAAADVTGDGVAEIITGAGPGGGPHVRVDGLQQQKVLGGWLKFYADDAEFTGGVFVAGGDVDGDGRAEVITERAVWQAARFRIISLPRRHACTELGDFYAYSPAFTVASRSHPPRRRLADGNGRGRGIRGTRALNGHDVDGMVLAPESNDSLACGLAGPPRHVVAAGLFVAGAAIRPT